MELRKFGFVDFLLLLLTLALAGGARAGYLLTCCDGGRNAGPLRVQDDRPPVPGQGGKTELEVLTQGVKERYSYSIQAPLADAPEPTAHTAPGLPWTLGLMARFLGEAAFEKTVRWAHCGLGALTAGLYFLFARRAFRSLFVGTLAGVFCALHPFWIMNTAAIDDGVLTTFLLALALFLGARAVQTGGAFASLLYGLTLAGLALVRASCLPFAFVAVGWFLLRSRHVARGWLCALLAFLGFANGLTPWTVRNWQQFHEPVPVVDSAYLYLWGGNHAGATGGPVPWSAWVALESDDLAKLPQPQRYAKLAPLVVQEVRTHPVQTMQRRLGAALHFFFGERWFRDGVLAQENIDADPMPAWFAEAYPGALAGTLLGMLVLGLLGWRWTYGWRDEAMPSSLALIWIPLPYVLAHAEALSGPRLPLDGVLLCYAAFALACLIPGLSGKLLAGARPARTRDAYP